MRPKRVRDLTISATSSPHGVALAGLMNVGFDPGCHEMRVLGQRGRKLVARQAQTAYSVLPDEPAHRQVLVDSRLPFALCDGHLVLLGAAVPNLGVGIHCPTWSLMPYGRIDQDDPLVRQILTAQLEALFPPSPTPESLCGFSFPHESIDRHADTFAATRNFLTHWIQSRGYTPVEISSGQALVLAELSSTGFTGLAVTFGSAFCTYSLCFRGEELVTGYVALGGQWLDEQLAGQLHRYCLDNQGRKWLDTAGIAAWKIGSAPSLLAPRNPEAALLRDLYFELLEAVCQQLFEDLSKDRLPSPLPRMSLLVSGGLTKISGFREILNEHWLRPRFPLEIDEIRVVNDSPHTIARGCLIHVNLLSANQNAAKRVA